MSQKEGKKKFAFSKKVTVFIFLIFAIGGVIASFKDSFIVIDSYVKMLASFAPFFIAYITIVGAGRGAKKIAEMKYHAGENETTTEVQVEQGGK